MKYRCVNASCSGLVEGQVYELEEISGMPGQLYAPAENGVRKFWYARRFVKAGPGDTLDRAFAADPRAIHTLISARVPCNQALEDDPTIVVDSAMFGPMVGALGLINGILADLGLPLVASRWSEPGEDGRAKLLGFGEYKPTPEVRP